MEKFSNLVLEILNEQGKTFGDLEKDNIICKRSFYQYKDFTPFLPKILEIANYLQVSLDYLCNRATTTNDFKKYSVKQNLFFDKLNSQLKLSSISKFKLAKDLNLGRANFTYWKNGSTPKLSTLIAIANYLGCDIDDLLEHE